MPRLPSLLLSVALSSCVPQLDTYGSPTVWARNEQGIYPTHLGFNGEDYLLGWKLPVIWKRDFLW